MEIPGFDPVFPGTGSRTYVNSLANKNRCRIIHAYPRCRIFLFSLTAGDLIKRLKKFFFGFYLAYFQVMFLRIQHPADRVQNENSCEEWCSNAERID